MSSALLLSQAPPQSPEWFAARADGIGSSEIAAVMGLSPWESPFSLWWHKKLRQPGEPNAAMRWGTRLEPIIREAWADTHEEFRVEAAPGVFAHPERSWQRASPDGLVCEGVSAAEPVAVIECKSDHHRAGWGEPGSADIPVHYTCQVQWQMDVLGVPAAYVAVTFGGEPLEFVVPYDPDDCALMRAAARAFLDSLAADEPPALDAHAATTRTLKALHPTVADVEVGVSAVLVRKRADAARREKHWSARKDLYDNRIRDLLADARYGVADGRRLVSRSVAEIAESTYTRRAYTRHSLHYYDVEEKDA